MIKNSLRRFLIVSVLAAAGVASALACGPWGRPHYYVFSAYQRNEMGNTFTDRMQQFWVDYAPQVKESRYEIGGLSWIDPADFDTSDNTIIKTARDKNDKEMLDYLRLLVKYLNISSNISSDEWGYPTKEEVAQRSKDLKYINYCARSYSGTRLSGQYSLLAMRANMLMGDHGANMAYWSNRCDKLAASVYKDMMKDIYAGALFRMGKLSEAASIYYELGDMNSLMWIMRDQRNLDGIKKEYARDPNSPALIFLVQDQVNSLSDTRYYINKYETTEDLPQSNSEISAFIAFAQKVLKDGKTQSPALWQTAMGWLNHSLGKDKDAVSQLEKAMKMGGTERMRDNARVCRFVTMAESMEPGKKLTSFLKQELQWMAGKEKVEPADADCYACSQNHYTEVMQNVIYDSLAPRLVSEGNTNLATALVGWMDFHTDVYDDYKTALDKLSADQLMSYSNYLNGSPESDFEAWLTSDLKMDANMYNDMVGTKMIREGRFAQAIPFLEKVSLAYLSSQAIAPYAAARDYHVEQCFTRQHNTAGDFPVAIKTNVKLDYCREMVESMARYSTLEPGIERAEVAYALAKMYQQASYRGDCWYLSRYGNSVYDTVCYTGEKDFLAEAAKLYSEALAQPGLPLKYTQCFLYAAAYLPFGNPYATVEYDEEYNAHNVIHRDSYQYKALLALDKHLKQSPSFVAPYITRCDVLRQFRDAL